MRCVGRGGGRCVDSVCLNALELTFSGIGQGTPSATFGLLTRSARSRRRPSGSTTTTPSTERDADPNDRAGRRVLSPGRCLITRRLYPSACEWPWSLSASPSSDFSAISNWTSPREFRISPDRWRPIRAAPRPRIAPARVSGCRSPLQLCGRSMANRVGNPPSVMSGGNGSTRRARAATGRSI